MHAIADAAQGNAYDGAMGKLLMMAALMTGCADNAEPSLDPRPCVEFDVAEIDDPIFCPIDLTGHTVIVGQSPDSAFFHDVDGTNQSLFNGGGHPQAYAWAGDPAPGVAVLVGEALPNEIGQPALQDPARTCAWRRCE